MQNNLENPFYYLENFQFVLHWVRQRYRDLLTEAESAFIEQFEQLPIASRALLVRMVMRKAACSAPANWFMPRLAIPVLLHNR